MPETFSCPNCGAPLDYKGSDPIIRCPYCNSSVVVPENLRAKPEFSSKPSNFTLSGAGNLGGLINQARRFKEVKDLAQAGDMDEAVRVYCEITGVSPELARPSVEALAHGRPITLSSLNVGDVMGAVQVAKTPPPSASYQPANQKSSRGIGRAIGCGIGCFVVGLVIFILVTVLVPTLGGLAGVYVGLNPDLALTALPYVSGSGYGTRELSFGGEGTGPGLFEDVRAIAVDPASGKIYAADYSNGRVQEFDAQGKFITQWIVEGKNMYIQSLAADRKGNVYIAASGKLLRYNSEGKLLGEVKTGDSIRFDNAVLSADGTLIAADGEDIYHLAADGKILTQIPAALSTVTGDSELNAKVAVDGQGNIYVLGTFSNAVFKFNAKGKFLNQFGSDGDQPGQFRAPYAIAADGKGRIYVSDTKGVQVFSNDGRYINVITVEYFAYGLAFDDQGKLYVTTNQKKVEKFSIPE
jgi:DNA-binding beta-propeller fold protein YncE/DNA-directed RNA polymerase subunit RPC12/RpoP